MNYIKHLTGFFEKLVLDNDLNPTHVSLYIALFQGWNLNRFKNPISISRDEVMRISKIYSKATYHKCVKELHDKGYIVYEPSYNPFRGSLVWLINFESNVSLQTKKNNSSLKNNQSDNPTNEQELNNNRTTSKASSVQALVPSINNTNRQNISKLENGHSLEKKTEPEIQEQEEAAQTEKKKKKFREKKETKISETIPPPLEKVKEFFVHHQTEETEAERFFNHFQSNGWLVGGKSKMKNWEASAKNWILNLQSFMPVVVGNSNPVPGNLKTSNTKKYDEPL